MLLVKIIKTAPLRENIIKSVRKFYGFIRQRDVKGLNAKDENGLIKNMIGITPTSSYQLPKSPDFVINPEKEQFSTVY